MLRFSMILITSFLLSCGAEDGTKATETAEACADSNALAQCPPRSQGMLEANAASNCNSSGSISVDVDGVSMEGSGSGAISQVCVGSGSCRVVCTLADTCEYGVESVHPTDGVVCRPEPTCGNEVCDGGEDPTSCPQDCETACGDNTCDGDENPDTCPEDCSEVVCTDGATRCSGNAIERCNQMGVWETTPCPDSQICNEENGVTECTDEPLDCAAVCATLFTNCVESSNICQEGTTLDRAAYDTHCERRCQAFPTRFEEYLMTPDDCQAAADSRALVDRTNTRPPFCRPDRNPPPPTCGDGAQDDGEECDDGNQLDGDGCAADCTLESSCDEACQTLCATTCSALWENCMNPVGRPENATQCPGAALQAHTETCTELCRDEAQHGDFVEISEDPTRCVRAHNNLLFTCDPSECGNGACEYGETRAGNGQQCQADCR